jgi:hypothetical protein
MPFSAVAKSGAMNNPFGKSLSSGCLYAGAWGTISVLQVLLLSYYRGDGGFPLPFYIYYDTLISNGLQALCLLVLWYPIRYYRNRVSLPLFVLFHALLFVLSVAIWLGAGYLLTRAVVADDPLYSDFFIRLLPIRIFFGGLTYLLFTLAYYLLLSTSTLRAQQEAMNAAVPPTGTATIEKLSRISVKKHKEIRFIPVGQIYYIEANGDYVMIHTATDRFLKDKSMKYWEMHLPDDVFVRVHRSFIVHIEWIAGIELYEKESYKILLKNGESLKASSAGYKALKQKMLL